MTSSGQPPPDGDDVVRTAVDGPVLTITIDRPRARNAIDAAVAAGIDAAVTRLETDDALAVGVLTGAGGFFSAGMDLKAFLRGEDPSTARGFAGLVEAPPDKPLIAAVEGTALAGGCELALACDLIVASQEASFGLPEVRRGLIAGAGGLMRLPERIPPSVAMELALTGAPMSAADAHRWGLVARLTPVGGALDGARELAAAIGANGPLAVRQTKRVIVESRDWSRDERWARMREALGPIKDSADAREGAAAFAEKREPRWTGR